MLRIRERGEGRMGALIALIVVVGGGMFAWEYIPARVSRAQLKDFMTEQASYAGRVNSRNLEKSILDEAKRLNLPVKEEDIKVEIAAGRVRMKVSYVQPLEFPGYTWDYQVQETLDRPFFKF